MSVYGSFNVALYAELEKMASLHESFNDINFLRHVPEKDRPEYDLTRFPYTIYWGRLNYIGRSCARDIYVGTYTFQFWDKQDILCAAAHEVFSENFMHESVFKTFDVGGRQGTVLLKEPSGSNAQRQHREAMEFRQSVFFKIDVPRQKGETPAVYS